MGASKLLDNVSGDTSTADADGFNPRGAKTNIQVDGTLGGASIFLYGSLDGGVTRVLLAFQDGSDAELITNTIVEVDRLAIGYKIYAQLVGGSPSGVTVTAVN